MLPKRLRRPGLVGTSKETPSRACTQEQIGYGCEWFSPRLPCSSEVVRDLLQAEHVEVGDATRLRTTRSRSSRRSIPRPIGCPGDQPHISLANAGAHEALHELPLEEEKTKKEGPGRHEGGGADDGPIDALIARREHLQPDGQGPRLDGVGDDQGPEKVVPVVAHGHKPVGDVGRPGQGHIDLEQHLQGAGSFHASRVLELLGHALEGLAEEEDAEGGSDVRQADGRDGVDQLSLLMVR